MVREQQEPQARKRARERSLPLLLSTGELGGRLLTVLSKIHHLKQAGRSFPDLFCSILSKLQPYAMFCSTFIFETVRMIEISPLFRRRPEIRHISTVQNDLSAARHFEPRDYPQDRGLPLPKLRSTTISSQRHRIYVVEDHCRTKALAYIANTDGGMFCGWTSHLFLWFVDRGS